jgi:hypothetical protein
MGLGKKCIAISLDYHALTNVDDGFGCAGTGGADAA